MRYGRQSNASESLAEAEGKIARLARELDSARAEADHLAARVADLEAEIAELHKPKTKKKTEET